MKITDLKINQQIVIQIIIGEQNMEFRSNVIAKDENGAFATPYRQNNKPLEMNIDSLSKVVCNIYAVEPESDKRVTWRNVALATKIRRDETVYYITTSGFNRIAKYDDRRRNERVKVNAVGKLYNSETDKYEDIRIHDVSDGGISFYVKPDYDISAREFKVMFDDEVNNKLFNIVVDCDVVRFNKDKGPLFCGCRTVGNTNEYLVYESAKRQAVNGKSKPN